MCVLNVFNFTNNKLHLLPLNCFCFMSQAPSFSCPRKTIQSLSMSRKRCSFFMCVLNVFYCKIAFVATKLPVSFMYVVGSLDTVVILNCVVSCSWLPLTSCPRRVSLCRNIAFIAIKGRAQIDHAFSVGLRRLPPPHTHKIAHGKFNYEIFPFLGPFSHAPPSHWAKHNKKFRL